jgi:hypothetical protein
MLAELWLFWLGGLLFTRLASSIGLVGARRLEGGASCSRWDGTFLVDRPCSWADRGPAVRLVDPLKTPLSRQRCMTTWCLRKPEPPGAPAANHQTEQKGH